MTKSFSEEEIIYIVNSYGYNLISWGIITRPNYVRKVVDIEDKEGYKYKLPISRLIKNNGSCRFLDKSNPYSLENINLWILKNNFSFELSLNNEYVNSSCNLELICKKCGEKFYSPWAYIYSGTSCPYCSGREVGDKNNLEALYPEIAKEWNYSYNNGSPSQYTSGNTERFYWICSKCGYGKNGEWKTSIYNRKRGTGCPSCKGKVVSENNRLSTLYPEISLEWHPSLNKDVTPDNVSYGSEKRFWWLCSKCSFEWEATPNNRTNMESGCPRCSMSKGEKRIESWLFLNKIVFEREYDKFEDCKNINVLSFDFYLPDYNLCVEYNGEQHYREMGVWGGSDKLKRTIKNDKIKVKYCEDNNIVLLVIPYWNYNKIEEILEKTLSELG